MVTISSQKQPVLVAYRTAEILEVTKIDEWKQVRDGLNPADIGTRAMSVDDLKESVWLNGPAWLIQPKDKWPVMEVQPQHFQDTASSEVVVLLAKAQLEPLVI